MVSKKKMFVAIVATFVITAVIVGIFTFSITNAFGSKLNNDDKLNEIGAVNELISTDFYKKVDSDKLITAAIDGMVASLEDPYSTYYDEEEWIEFIKDQQGEYTGIGVQVTFEEEIGGVKVNRVFENSPAFEAGILVGDIIVGADGNSFEGVGYEDIVKAIRGEPETKVLVDVLRKEEAKSFTIIRKVVFAEQAFYSMVDKDIGYLEMYSFTGNALKKFKESIDYFTENNAKGIIIDLRNNPGGDLFQVTEMLDILLPEGKLIITKDRQGIESVMESDKVSWDTPIAVLVNENSASASELFSIAIQDYERGPIVGETTFGKGVVQTILPLDDGDTGVKFTTSEYFSPLGRSIHDIGVYPDYYIVDENLEDEIDPQMDKAIELLTK
jgi:carboxyl-terminal processing protease